MSRPRTTPRRRVKTTGDLASSARPRPAADAPPPGDPPTAGSAPSDPTAAKVPGRPKTARRIDLASEARANPFLFFTSEETGLMFGLGENVMTALRSMGAPVVGRKMNPVLLMEWLKQNHERVPKVRGDEE